MLRMVSRPTAETVDQLPQEYLPGFVGPIAPDGVTGARGGDACW